MSSEKKSHPLPNDYDPVDVMGVQSIIDKCCDLYQGNKFEEAAGEARCAIAEYPDYAIGYRYLARALIKAGRPQEALAPAIKAKELEPDNPTNQHVLAKVMKALGHEEAGSRLSKDALAATPRATAMREAFRGAKTIEEGRELVKRNLREPQADDAFYRHLAGLLETGDLAAALRFEDEDDEQKKGGNS